MTYSVKDAGGLLTDGQPAAHRESEALLHLLFHSPWTLMATLPRGLHAVRALIGRTADLAPCAPPQSEGIHWVRAWSRAMRSHQWLKNLLILLPALAAHQIDTVWPACLLALISFSLCASAGYVINDLADTWHDRRHPVKCRRPFAAGDLSPLLGLAAAPLLLAVAFAVAFPLPGPVLGVLAGYVVLSTIYTVWLKKHIIIDVVALAFLYGARLMAGSQATGVELSAWLVAMAIFLFLCLALTKRCTEIIDRIGSGSGDPAGRGYRLSDLPVLEGMAISSGFVGVLVVALYINSPTVSRLYRHPELLWLSTAVLVYWLARIILLCHRGEMHEDPILFAARDGASLLCLAALVAIVIASL